MRTKLELAHDISSIGTFLLTIVIVGFLVVPIVRPSEALPQPTPSIAIPPGHPMIGWLMPSILAFGLILAGVLHFLAARQIRQAPSLARAEIRETAPPALVQQSPQTPAPLASLRTLPATNSEGRIFVGPEITPQFLSGILRENTDIQAQKLFNIYIGKWMRLSGAISEVSELTSAGTCMVAFFKETLSGTSVFMYFGAKWHGQLSILRRGNTITVEGKIRDVDWTAVRLEECDLV